MFQSRCVGGRNSKCYPDADGVFSPEDVTLLGVQSEVRAEVSSANISYVNSNCVYIISIMITFLCCVRNVYLRQDLQVT